MRPMLYLFYNNIPRKLVSYILESDKSPKQSSVITLR